MNATQQVQRRVTHAGRCELRAADGDAPQKIVGYAAVFYRAGDAGTEYLIWDDLVERIDRNAFASALARPDDVRALFNHAPDNILGRTAAGTLRLTTDDVGLRYEIAVPDTAVGRDLAASIGRGDITGSSFSFTVLAEERVNEPNRQLRIVKDVELFDVGPVTFPAYEATSAGVLRYGRMPDEAPPAELLAWRAARAKERENAAAWQEYFRLANQR